VQGQDQIAPRRSPPIVGDLLERFDAFCARRRISQGMLRLGAVVGGGAAIAAALALSTSDGTTSPALAAQHGAKVAKAAAKQPGRPITIAWAGDTTLGSSHGLPPQNGWVELAPVASLLRAADLTAVNSEGTFSTGGTSKCGGPDTATCFAFQAPPQNAQSLHRAGVDIVNLANNHAFDYGATGLGQTVTALNKAGVDVTGRPYEIRTLTVNGAKVAFAGFSAYPWTSPISDPVAIKKIITLAKQRANVVVAFVHAGAEGADQIHTPTGDEVAFGEDRGSVRGFAHAAIDAGADLVLGSGPHVMRGMELYKHRLVAYSMGNLAGYNNFGTGGNLSVSGVLRVTVASDGRFLVGRLDPLLLDGTGIPHRDPAKTANTLVSTVSKADFGAAAVTVDGNGDLQPPGGAQPFSAPAGAR
jgi:hypothetical protein